MPAVKSNVDGKLDFEADHKVGLTSPHIHAVNNPLGLLVVKCLQIALRTVREELTIRDYDHPLVEGKTCMYQ